MVLQQVGLQVVPCRGQSVHRQRVKHHPKAQPEFELKKVRKTCDGYGENEKLKKLLDLLTITLKCAKLLNR
jgi:hypothetical protein